MIKSRFQVRQETFGPQGLEPSFPIHAFLIISPSFCTGGVYMVSCFRNDEEFTLVSSTPPSLVFCTQVSECEFVKRSLPGWFTDSRNELAL